MSQSGTSASSLPGNIAKRFRAAREKRGQQDDYWDEVIEKRKAEERTAKAKKRARLSGSDQTDENKVVADSSAKLGKSLQTEPRRKASVGLERYQLEVCGGMFVSGRKLPKKEQVKDSLIPEGAGTDANIVAIDEPQSVEFQRFKMVALYESCNPTKVDEVGALLNRYQGQHSTMWAKLEEKYGAEALAVAHATAVEREATFKAMEVVKQVSSQPAKSEAAANAAKKKRRKDIVRVRIRGQTLTPKKKKVKKDLSYSKWRSMSKNERKAYNRP